MMVGVVRHPNAERVSQALLGARAAHGGVRGAEAARAQRERVAVEEPALARLLEELARARSSQGGVPLRDGHGRVRVRRSARARDALARLVREPGLDRGHQPVARRAHGARR
ncbi:MAG: hypothetical protein M5U28_50355 [Sandaracinaceae bacterium]|nr:hypothetical protein [Sandaracinaceae bacterium]